MTVINPKALVAAQVYGTAQPAERPAPTPAHKLASAPRALPEDRVTLRGAAGAAGTEAAPPQSQSAPQRPRRPGMLVDIKA